MTSNILKCGRLLGYAAPFMLFTGPLMIAFSLDLSILGFIGAFFYGSGSTVLFYRVQDTLAHCKARKESHVDHK